jgi:anti-sigma regulatory factor (Ser/Thr protein kinase)
MFYSQTLPKSPGSAGTARGLLARVRGEVPEAVFDDARLLVSELVANAVEHVAEDGDIEVRVALSDDVLRIEVLDPGPGFEYLPRSAAGGNERGWGLHFASRVASAWGKDVAGRARVWVELRTS